MTNVVRPKVSRMIGRLVFKTFAVLLRVAHSKGQEKVVATRDYLMNVTSFYPYRLA